MGDLASKGQPGQQRGIWLLDKEYQSKSCVALVGESMERVVLARFINNNIIIGPQRLSRFYLKPRERVSVATRSSATLEK